MKPLHRPFIALALTFVLLGSGLGLLMLPRLANWSGPAWWLGDGLDWVHRLHAHGPFQVFGFAVLFTMGIAYQMLAELLGARQSPGRLRVCLVAMAVGTLGDALSAWPLWAWLQFLSGLTFVVGVASHRPPVGTVRRNVAHSHYLRWGSLWLLAALLLHALQFPVARVYELVLWGFLSLYILGVGLRVHPAMFGRQPPPAKLQWAVLGLWNAALLLTFVPHGGAPASLCWLLASLLFVGGMRPWAARPGKLDWPLTAYLSWSYLWLVLACAGRFGLAFELCPSDWAGAIKHAHASGFILIMMVGMGLRLVPAFERKPLAWPAARHLCLGFLVSGAGLRVAGQAGLWPWALVPGGALQMIGVLLFVGSLLATLVSPVVSTHDLPGSPFRELAQV